MRSRWVEHGSLVNLRDLGSIPLKDGGWLAPGHVFRGAMPGRISDEDATWLRGVLGIDRVIDLRTDAERRLDGDDESMARARIEIDRVPVDEGGWGASAGADRTPGFYVGRYKLMVGAMGAPLERLLEAVGRGERALVACTAGKDRTGVLAALFLGALGATEAAIVQDYALSGRCLRRQVDAFRDHWERKGLSRHQYARRLETPASTMRALVAWLREQFGGVGRAAASLVHPGAIEPALTRLRRAGPPG